MNFKKNELMNKLLTILYFIMLVSNSISEICPTDCRFVDYISPTIGDNDPTHYICTYDPEYSGLCNIYRICKYKIIKPIEHFDCSIQYVSDTSKYKCVDNPDKTGCEEISIC